MDSILSARWMPYVAFGCLILSILVLVAGVWFQKCVDDAFDAGFRAGQNPEAGGWEFL